MSDLQMLFQSGLPVYPVADGSRGIPVQWIDPETDVPVIPSALVDNRIVAKLPDALGGMGVGDVGTFTLATLPDPALTPRRTVWVSDMYTAGGRMVSEGGFWKPIRPLVTGGMASPSSDLTLQPLLHPTTLIVTGALAATRNLTLGLGSGFALPYPGYRQRVTRKATGLFNLVTNGVGLGLNGWADFEFDGVAWQQTASGGLL